MHTVIFYHVCFYLTDNKQMKFFSNNVNLKNHFHNAKHVKMTYLQTRIFLMNFLYFICCIHFCNDFEGFKLICKFHIFYLENESKGKIRRQQKCYFWEMSAILAFFWCTYEMWKETFDIKCTYIQTYTIAVIYWREPIYGAHTTHSL